MISDRELPSLPHLMVPINAEKCSTHVGQGSGCGAVAIVSVHGWEHRDLIDLLHIYR